MLFNSLTFLVFFAIILGLHSLPLNWQIKKSNLLIASYLFYAAWNPPFVLLLWISTVVDWLVAGKMAATTHQKKKTFLLVISLVVNLGLLSYFKYATFVLDNFVFFINQLGFVYHPALPSIILPVGISFYTFQTLSYTIDVYRGEKPCDSFLDFALFVTFFPQLVAGPIVRSSYFLPQCKTPKQATEQQLSWGLSLLIIGLFQKTILADSFLAPVVEQVFNNAMQTTALDNWLGTFAFSAQIFFDFAGYSTSAIGAALCFGFVLPDNFRAPYAAVGFSDFWRRWHISLSTWLRDYLYIALGGNRNGTLQTYRNLFLTMLLGGLWHGAAWGFIVWGFLHGFYLIIERLLRPYFENIKELHLPIAQFSLALITYFLVCIAWVFFRANDVFTAFTMLKVMFLLEHAPNETILLAFSPFMVIIIVAGLFLFQWFNRENYFEQVVQKLPANIWAVFLAILVLWLLLAPGDQRAFIYFQF
jgi:D-alanyl-lipoteichoic acid acyltransferase DltB (MBOAT superfamily)